MTHRYKRYSREQLQAEEAILRKRLREAEQAGRRSHVAVNRRKIEIVQSYMLNRAAFNSGDIRSLKEDPEHLFQIYEVSGVVAWGHRIDRLTHDRYEEKEAILIALLGRKVQALR